MLDNKDIIHLSITTPDNTVFDSFVQEVTLPGSRGSFQVLKDHAPLASTLQHGDVCYVANQKEGAVSIPGGIVEVLNNKVTILMFSAS